MKDKIDLILRILLGLGLAVFGLNKFLHFLQMPETTPAAGKLMGALAEAGFYFPILGVIYLVVAVMLLANRFVAFGLLLLAPVFVNILLIHGLLDPAGIGAGLLFSIMIAALAILRWDKYAPLFKG